MLPVNTSGHAAYQNFVAANLRKYYLDPDAFSPAVWDIIERFWHLDLSYTDDLLRPAKEKRIKKPPQKGAKAEPVEKVSVDQLLEQLETTAFVLKDQPYSSLFEIYHRKFLSQSISKGLLDPSDLSLADDGAPVVTSARE